MMKKTKKTKAKRTIQLEPEVLRAVPVGVEHDRNALLTHLAADAGRFAAGVERLAAALERQSLCDELRTRTLEQMAVSFMGILPSLVHRHEEPPPPPPAEEQPPAEDVA